jgi:PIN domain nuclease of toxin-antitoxin system
VTSARRLLLDTHVVLWWLADDPTLSDELKVAIDEEVDVFVSAATVWEVAIKQQLGKIAAPSDLPERIRDCDLANLSITSDHAIAAGRLPLVHRDPFDRVIVAQARCEGLTLVTRDAALGAYDVPLLPA